MILIAEKLKHSNTGFKYFISDKDDNIIRHLCTILPKMSGYIKYFDNEWMCPLWLKIISYW